MYLTTIHIFFRQYSRQIVKSRDLFTSNTWFWINKFSRRILYFKCYSACSTIQLMIYCKYNLSLYSLRLLNYRNIDVPFRAWMPELKSYFLLHFWSYLHSKIIFINHLKTKILSKQNVYKIYIHSLHTLMLRNLNLNFL